MVSCPKAYEISLFIIAALYLGPLEQMLNITCTHLDQNQPVGRSSSMVLLFGIILILDCATLLP